MHHGYGRKGIANDSGRQRLATDAQSLRHLTRMGWVVHVHRILCMMQELLIGKTRLM